MAINQSKPLEVVDEATYDRDRGQAAKLATLEVGGDYRMRVLRYFSSPEERAHEHWVRVASKGPVKGFLSKHADVRFIPLTDDALPQPELAETRRVLVDGTVTLKVYEVIMAYGIPGNLLEFGYIPDQDTGFMPEIPAQIEPIRTVAVTF